MENPAQVIPVIPEAEQSKSTYSKNHRKYYSLHRDEISLKKKEQYRLHAEAEKARSRERYWRKKQAATVVQTA